MCTFKYNLRFSGQSEVYYIFKWRQSQIEEDLEMQNVKYLNNQLILPG